MSSSSVTLAPKRVLVDPPKSITFDAAKAVRTIDPKFTICIAATQMPQEALGHNPPASLINKVYNTAMDKIPTALRVAIENMTSAVRHNRVLRLVIRAMCILLVLSIIGFGQGNVYVPWVFLSNNYRDDNTLAGLGKHRLKDVVCAGKGIVCRSVVSCFWWFFHQCPSAKVFETALESTTRFIMSSNIVADLSKSDAVQGIKVLAAGMEFLGQQLVKATVALQGTAGIGLTKTKTLLLNFSFVSESVQIYRTQGLFGVVQIVIKAIRSLASTIRIVHASWVMLLMDFAQIQNLLPDQHRFKKIDIRTEMETYVRKNVDSFYQQPKLPYAIQNSEDRRDKQKLDRDGD